MSEREISSRVDWGAGDSRCGGGMDVGCCGGAVVLCRADTLPPPSLLLLLSTNQQGHCCGGSSPHALTTVTLQYSAVCKV